MAQLRQDFSAFEETDTVIVAIGPESAEAFRQYWQDNDLPFIGLPDPSHSVLKLYGQQIKLFKFGRMPAQVIIDKRGVVRYVHYGHDMTDIPGNDELLGLIHTLPEQASAAV